MFCKSAAAAAADDDDDDDDDDADDDDDDINFVLFTTMSPYHKIPVNSMIKILTDFTSKIPSNISINTIIVPTNETMNTAYNVRPPSYKLVYKPQ